MPENKGNIREIDPAGTRVAEVTEELDSAVARMKLDQGNDIGGFAIVAWDMGGRCTTSYYAGYGLVSRGLVPSLVHDAIQRHIIVNMVEEGQESDNAPRPDDSA